jgi:hydrogenase nickel incorporation protein HypA/HybF
MNVRFKVNATITRTKISDGTPIFGNIRHSPYVKIKTDIALRDLMHEVSVTAQLVEAILKELEKYNVVSVKAVTLVIGKLTNLGKEQMAFAYEIVTRGTILEGSELIIEEEDIILKCTECGFEGPAKNLNGGDYPDEHFIPVLACSECGGSVIVVKGQTCSVKNMDIEEAE